MSTSYTRTPKLPKGTKWRYVATFSYRDAANRLRLRVERQAAVTPEGLPVMNEKKGKQVKRCPQTYFGVDGAKLDAKPPSWRPIPYHLPELLAARERGETLVFVAEGEPKVDQLRRWDLVATCNAEGAGKWDPSFAEELRGFRVVSLPDNDDEGRRHVDDVGRSLAGAARSHQVLELPDLGPGEDIVDWVKRGGTKEKFLELVETAARDWSPYFPEQRKTYELVWAKDVVPRGKEWIWKGHLLRGALELLTGIKGMGKSQVHCDTVGRLTTGAAMPDGTPSVPPGNVIMVTAEDCLDDEVVPRLIAVKADLSRVAFLRRIKKDKQGRMFLLGEDLDVLEQMIRDIGEIALVTLDPITAYMGKINNHMTTDVRSQLGPLKDLTERTRVAFSAITHPAKNASPRAIDHFIGTQAYIAAARLGHVCVPELDADGNPTGRILYASIPSNVGSTMPTLAFRKDVLVVGRDLENGANIEAPHIKWEKDPVALTADQAVSAVKTAESGNGKKSDGDGARTFLEGLLANGPVPAKVVFERAEQCGFSEWQIKRAKAKAKPGIPARKVNGAWVWGGDPQEEMPF